VNDLEEQLRGSLERLAGPVVARVAPEGIRARVRRRRIGVALVAACTSLALAGAAVAVIRRPVPPVVVPTNPYASLPPDWPAVATTEDPGAVVAGTVDGIGFRLTATTADGGDPCLHLLVDGQQLGTLCRSTSDAPVPTRADLDLGVLRGGALGDLRAHLGFVSERTASLVAFYDGIDHPMPVFAEPDGWNVRPFLFFPPSRFDGWVDAIDGAGNPLAETSLCGSLNTQMGCIRLVDQVAVIPGRYTPPPPGRMGSPPGDSWEYLDPIVRAEPTGDRVVDIAWGGSFTPYVDLELPSPVSGKKIVVTYGRAGGLEFALAVYDTNGRYDSDGGSVAQLSWGHAYTESDLGEVLGVSSLEAGVPPGQDVSLVLAPRRAPDGTRFEFVYGWASDRVDHVEFRMQDGWTQRVPVEHAGPTDGYGWVIAFIPDELGAAVPVTSDGRELARWALCVDEQGAPVCPSWSHG
jgi:hypothetical protein